LLQACFRASAANCCQLKAYGHAGGAQAVGIGQAFVGQGVALGNDHAGGCDIRQIVGPKGRKAWIAPLLVSDGVRKEPIDGFGVEQEALRVVAP
jgi:hypothetical protein